jgi:hypothetical protein
VVGVEIINGQVFVTLPKVVLVMTKQEFMESLKHGKAWRRRQSPAQRPTTYGVDGPRAE